jgi:hypothetical protein
MVCTIADIQETLINKYGFMIPRCKFWWNGKI